MTTAVSTKKRAGKLAVIGALIVVAALLIRPVHREPVYQGRALSSWFDEFDASAGDSADAREALRAIGANAVPYLVQELTRRPAGRERYVRLASEVPRWVYRFLPNWSHAPWKRRANVAMALGELGPAARDAVPSLLGALNDATKSRSCAFGRPKR